LANNHRGIDETVAHLRRSIYFPLLKTKVTHIINDCDVCQTLKYDRQPQKIEFSETETQSHPMQIINTDIYTINGKTILTKFAAGYTIMTRDSLNVVKSMRNFISTFGIPKKLICGQGSEFANKLFKNFCAQYNIILHFTSFQQSSSNSPVERLHSSLTEIYRIILNKRKTEKLSCDHEDIFFETLTTYNNSIHSTTKYTPFEIFHGKPHLLTQGINPNNEHDYLQKLNEFRNTIYPDIKENMENKMKDTIAKSNEDRNPPIALEVGKTVFRKENRRNKLTPRFKKHTVKGDKGLYHTKTKIFIKKKLRKEQNSNIGHILQILLRNGTSYQNSNTGGV